MKEPKNLDSLQIKDLKAEILILVEDKLYELDMLRAAGTSFAVEVGYDSQNEDVLVVTADALDFYTAEFSITIKHEG